MFNVCYFPQSSCFPLLFGIYSDYIFRQFQLRNCVLSLAEFFGHSERFKYHKFFTEYIECVVCVCMCRCQKYVPDRLIPYCCSKVLRSDVYFKLEVHVAIKTDWIQEGISVLLTNRPHYAASYPWHALFSEIDIYNFALDTLISWSEHTTWNLLWSGIFLF